MNYARVEKSQRTHTLLGSLACPGNDWLTHVFSLLQQTQFLPESHRADSTPRTSLFLRTCRQSSHNRIICTSTKHSQRPRSTRDVHNEQYSGYPVFRKQDQEYVPPSPSPCFLTNHHIFQTPTRHVGLDPARIRQKFFSTRNSVPTRATSLYTSCGMPASRAKTIHM